jgi:LAO/AO transport system kinase
VKSESSEPRAGTGGRSAHDLLDAARQGSVAATGRLLTLLERGGRSAQAVNSAAFPLTGDGYSVGLTGPPGVGKSTLVSALISEIRSAEERVAVLAIDPSSPFTGGAILGDRVRMDGHIADRGVFVRSLATRGELGGLARSVPEAIRLLDAVGFPWLVVETVGVGQIELDVAHTTDTVVVVVNPGWGDDVQAAKAGLLEIADVFVVNKADRPGADQTQRELEQMLCAGKHDEDSWLPPVLQTSAADGSGVSELMSAVNDHHSWQAERGTLANRRAERLWDETVTTLVASMERALREQAGDVGFNELRAALKARRLDPTSAADKILSEDDLWIGMRRNLNVEVD